MQNLNASQMIQNNGLPKSPPITPTKPPPLQEPMAYTQGDPRCPSFYIYRGERSIAVPLIPIDMLPPNIEIRGLPKALDVRDTLNMHNLGHYEEVLCNYELQDISMQPSASTLDGLTIPSRMEFESQGGAGVISRALSYPTAQNAISAQRYPSASQIQYRAPEAIESSAHMREVFNPGGNKLISSHPSGNIVDPAKKTHCTFWLQKGECSYTQQGCKYKHEMPDTLEGLLAVGLRQVPKWYRDQHWINEQSWRRPSPNTADQIVDLRPIRAIAPPPPLPTQTFAGPNKFSNGQMSGLALLDVAARSLKGRESLGPSRVIPPRLNLHTLPDSRVPEEYNPECANFTNNSFNKGSFPNLSQVTANQRLELPLTGQSQSDTNPGYPFSSASHQLQNLGSLPGSGLVSFSPSIWNQPSLQHLRHSNDQSRDHVSRFHIGPLPTAKPSIPSYSRVESNPDPKQGRN
ncbi:MAG: hypothetical protein M1829_004474 [Trizodia sp. TS-e1964]|nr:MAG: hypothetical protein M1829_004474 [Trizodia sp. TS-e1964]